MHTKRNKINEIQYICIEVFCLNNFQFTFLNITPTKKTIFAYQNLKNPLILDHNLWTGSVHLIRSHPFLLNLIKRYNLGDDGFAHHELFMGF